MEGPYVREGLTLTELGAKIHGAEMAAMSARAGMAGAGGDGHRGRGRGRGAATVTGGREKERGREKGREDPYVRA